MPAVRHQRQTGLDLFARSGLDPGDATTTPNDIDDALAGANFDAGESDEVRANASHDLRVFERQAPGTKRRYIAIRESDRRIARVGADVEAVNTFAVGVLKDRPQLETDQPVDPGGVDQLTAELRPARGVRVEHEDSSSAISKRSGSQRAGKAGADDCNVVIGTHGWINTEHNANIR